MEDGRFVEVAHVSKMQVGTATRSGHVPPLSERERGGHGIQGCAVTQGVGRSHELPLEPL